MFFIYSPVRVFAAERPKRKLYPFELERLQEQHRNICLKLLCFEAAYQGVLDAVNNGTLSEERINESLQRIYRVKYSDKVED